MVLYNDISKKCYFFRGNITSTHIFFWSFIKICKCNTLNKCRKYNWHFYSKGLTRDIVGRLLYYKKQQYNCVRGKERAKIHLYLTRGCIDLYRKYFPLKHCIFRLWNSWKLIFLDTEPCLEAILKISTPSTTTSL